jgi:hypothetical protein
MFVFVLGLKKWKGYSVTKDYTKPIKDPLYFRDFLAAGPFPELVALRLVPAEHYSISLCQK